jgi:CHASE2 domain-containing sensor protein
VRPVLAAGVVVLACCFALWAGGALTWPELMTLDLRYEVRGPQPLGAPVVVVPISQRMFELNSAFGSPYTWPLARAIYTHALANLRRAGARAVGLDVLLERATHDDGDLAAELAKWQGRAVLAYRPATDVGVQYGGATSGATSKCEATSYDVRRAGAHASAASLFLLPGGGRLAPAWPHGAG